MNRKIAAVAVAGLFASPVAALAQSSVTISGQLKMSFENLKLGDFSSARTGANTNKSQYGVADDSSKIIFNVREDLGGGLAAIGQLDIRVKPDDLGPAPAAVTAAQNTGNIVQGNSHLGLASKSWGRIFIGRQDLHYMNPSVDITRKNSERANSLSLLAFAGAYGVKGTTVNGGTAIAGTTRTLNVVHYTTPNWGGFTGIIAYSSNPNANDGDIAGPSSSLNADRKGRAWNLNPNYAAANWQVGYSYWNSKPDGGLASPVPAPTLWGGADQRGHRLHGDYTFGFGFRIGLAWDNSKLQGNSAGSDGLTLSKRTVWSIPVQYSFLNKHQITGHYTWAKNDKADMAEGLNTKAHMWAIGYSYDLSARTSVAVTYARINNRSNAGYSLYKSTSNGLGVAGVIAGEDPSTFGTTLRHAF